jgi:tRNA(fMet)-specific endonuclease VapC
MAVRRLCLDACAYAHFKRGHAPAVEAVRSARRVFVPVIVLGELRAGFMLGDQATRNESDLQAFLAQPVVAVLDVDDEASSIFAELTVDLRRAGTPLPTNDVWIAALAVREGATVLTYDSHFDRIRRAAARILS